MTLKEKIFHDYRKKHNTRVVVPCTEEETATYTALKKEGKELPANVSVSWKEENGVAYYVFKKTEEIEFTKEELDELLKYKEIELLTEIRKHTRFFYILSIIGLISIGVVGLILAVKFL